MDPGESFGCVIVRILVILLSFAIPFQPFEFVNPRDLEIRTLCSIWCLAIQVISFSIASQTACLRIRWDRDCDHL